MGFYVRREMHLFVFQTVYEIHAGWNGQKLMFVYRSDVCYMHVTINMCHRKLIPVHCAYYITFHRCFDKCDLSISPCVIYTIANDKHNIFKLSHTLLPASYFADSLCGCIQCLRVMPLPQLLRNSNWLRNIRYHGIRYTTNRHRTLNTTFFIHRKIQSNHIFSS